ncbi:hypothetical protein [[Haemophilus] ducreyi]
MIFAIHVANFTHFTDLSISSMYLDNTTQINSSIGGGMKVSFKKWLVSLNEVALNELGIDEMLTHLDDELNIINGNECEQEILNNLIQIFKNSEYH